MRNHLKKLIQVGVYNLKVQKEKEDYVRIINNHVITNTMVYFDKYGSTIVTVWYEVEE